MKKHSKKGVSSTKLRTPEELEQELGPLDVSWAAAVGGVGPLTLCFLPLPHHCASLLTLCPSFPCSPPLPPPPLFPLLPSSLLLLLLLPPPSSPSTTPFINLLSLCLSLYFFHSLGRRGGRFVGVKVVDATSLWTIVSRLLPHSVFLQTCSHTCVCQSVSLSLPSLPLPPQTLGPLSGRTQGL